MTKKLLWIALAAAVALTGCEKDDTVPSNVIVATNVSGNTNGIAKVGFEWDSYRADFHNNGFRLDLSRVSMNECPYTPFVWSSSWEVSDRTAKMILCPYLAAYDQNGNVKAAIFASTNNIYFLNADEMEVGDKMFLFAHADKPVAFNGTNTGSNDIMIYDNISLPKGWSVLAAERLPDISGKEQHRLSRGSFSGLPWWAFTGD